MLQQCSSASNCTRMRTRIVMEEHCSLCQHSTPFVMNGSTQFFQCFAIHFWRYCGPFLHEFNINTPFLSCPRKHLPSAFWQAENVYLNIFGLFKECVSIHCLDWFLAWTFTNKIQVSTPVTHAMWSRNSSPSLCYRSKMWKQKPFSAFCAHPWAFSKIVLHRTCDSIA
jgi:hypothetical protein